MTAQRLLPQAFDPEVLLEALALAAEGGGGRGSRRCPGGCGRRRSSRRRCPGSAGRPARARIGVVEGRAPSRSRSSSTRRRESPARRGLEVLGSRTSETLAPSEESIRRCASKSPWNREDTDLKRFHETGLLLLDQRVAPAARPRIIGAPRIKNRGPAAARRRRRCLDLKPGHRLAERQRGLGDVVGVAEVGGRLDDRRGAALRVLALEDS